MNAPRQPAGPGEFIFLSLLLGRPVLAPSGDRMGKLRDLVVSTREVYPAVEKLVFQGARHERRLVPWSEVRQVSPTIELRSAGPFAEAPLEAPPGQLYLGRDLLDRQIVDTLGSKVVRVNDLHLLRAGSDLRLVHVDVGIRGLVRRLGWQEAIDAIVRRVRPRAAYLRAEKYVSWKYVHPLGPQGSVQLSLPQRQLADLHPADLAEILEDLDREQRAEVFEQLPIETAADVLAEAEPRLQRELVDRVEPEHAADIVEEMEADQAADLLGDLPPAQAQEILAEMEAEEAQDVRELLSYEADTAGGLMNPEFVELPPDVTSDEAIGVLRTKARETEQIYSLYVTDEQERLLGTLSLRELIIAEPSARVRSIMAEHPITVAPDEALEAVAEKAAKYNLIAVPVVEESGRLVGVVTIDDVLDHVMERG